MKVLRLIGWQGFTLQVPDSWDLTGFSGREPEGYLRIDDSEEQAIEIKWATESPKIKEEPALDQRRQTYFGSLRKRAKKEKLSLEVHEVDAYRPPQRPDRTTVGFTWLADRKGIGAVWYCRTCRRVVIAQVLGPRSGKGGLMGVADAVLASIRCHGEDPAWRTWALYDLVTQVPVEYVLETQQLMNVYLKLSFTARRSARLSIEQWSLANVARRGAYLDAWLAANSKAELREARYTATEGHAHGHPALRLRGGLAFGSPMVNAVKQVTRLQRPATRFDATAWECEPSNKLYLVESLRPARDRDIVEEVAGRTLCHGGGMPA